MKQEKIVIKFAGDSGDGMQLTGTEFTKNSALQGLDISTFPDFPAEIRAPQGTTFGVSGFQVHFASTNIYTPGDEYDVLVVMNAAALKMNLPFLKPQGQVIANIFGFQDKNLRLAGYENNPLEQKELQEKFKLTTIDITKLTREELKDFNLGTKEMDRAKNMFVLGFLYWIYDRDITTTKQFLNNKFHDKPILLETNLRVLQAGYHYAETVEALSIQQVVLPKADLPKGTYRNIQGNQGIVLGLIAAHKTSSIPLFFSSYPITPASDILHEISKYTNKLHIKCVQAEDEIAASGMAVGASFAGSLGVTSTSGPGMSLKSETIGLAISLEIPLIICNIQRAGPSTGMPTKTEQADLLQAMYGRHGESPLVILSCSSTTDCFYMAYEACRLAITYMTPVVLMSDAYIANSSEPWRIPDVDSLPKIKDTRILEDKMDEKPFYPYERDENLVRKWVIPGVDGYESRFGGLEKQNITGEVSYDPKNHETMVKIRAKKIEQISDDIPLTKIVVGKKEGNLLLLGWGSTYGTLKTVTKNLIKQGHSVSHLHLNYIFPFQKNLGEVLKKFKHILIPELNSGQLAMLIRSKFLIDAKSYTKIQGLPIMVSEMENFIIKNYFYNLPIEK